MRIRKRAVPLPLSLLSPVPFPPSDPHLVQLPAGFQSSDHIHLLPPDQPLSSGNDLRPGTAPPPPPPPTTQLRPYEEDQREEISNPSKRIDSGAVAGADQGLLPFPSTPSSAHEKDSRWCDGDKAIPLKKRKASFEMNGVVVSEGESKMKSRTNKKCALSTTLELLDRDDDLDDDYSVDDSDDDPISTDDDGKTKKKKKKKKTTGKKGGGGGAKKKAEAGKSKKKKKQKKGGSIMEGSRCSRVNGRGWRCMQPTLVGYSLCEHHLGKGRLRSMSSVPAAPVLPKPDNAELGHSGNATQQDYSGVAAAAAGSKTKRRRIGMVKARSLSSLLGQPNTPVVQLGSTTTTATTTGDYKHMHEIN